MSARRGGLDAWRIAGATWLACLVVVLVAPGCGAIATEGAPPDAMAEDAAVDAAPLPPDTSLPPDEVVCSAGCPTLDPIDTSRLPWKPPTAPAKPCAPSDLDAVIAALSAPTPMTPISPAALGAAKAAVTSPTCRACIFAADEPTWAPLVELSSSSPEVLVNVGACIAIASGDESCGRAYQHWFDCRREACMYCVGVPGCEARCIDAVSGGACEEALATITTTCGADAARTADTICAGARHPAEGSIRAQCIGL